MNAITDILHLEGVSKRFSAGTRTIQALDDVSFSIRPGRVTGLIGPDGAGKTTLMRLATGLLIPDAGKLTVLDLDATSQSLAVQASVGYMPQRFGLYEDLSIRENLDLYADLQGVPIAERQSRYDELMHMTGLAPFMQRLAGRLSGGMKQKLGLACTLVHPPRLLLLDEPTVGVDPVSRRELWEIVYRLVEDAGMSVLLSTAYLDEAERCSEVVLLHEGHVLGQGAPEDFSREMQATAHEVTVRGMNKRRLQQRLSEIPGTVDAVVQGDAVRWVTRNAAPRLPENLPAPQIRRVEARFEDSFIERLRSEGNAGQASGLEAAMRPESGDGRAVIEVENLTRRFGDFVAVSGLGFHVARGEVFGLLGANGAGKTTTFRMLCGLLPPSDGSLQVAGHDLRHAAAEARARIGYMSQKFSLYTNLSVNQNLRFYASAYGLAGSQRANRIAWALAQFELEPFAHTEAGDLPLGYKQRLALAAALMHEPDILFLDEPTSGVDPLARREFWRHITALAEAGVTVLVTTHFMEEAEYCDRMIIMAAGKVLAEGSPSDIRRQAATAENPDPDMEDAFIDLIQRHDNNSEAA